MKASELMTNLPLLEGTEKQIVWAEQIRLDMLAQASTRLEGALRVAREQGKEISETGEKAYREALLKIREAKSAKWFIDFRSQDGLILLGMIANGKTLRS